MTFKDDARPLSVCFCVLGLIIAGGMDAIGYPWPREIIIFMLSYAGEWSVERAIRKKKNV